MKLKNIVKKIIFKEKADSNSYIKYLRKLGIDIGNDCIIYAPTKTIIDTQNPHMIKIGNNVKITLGVKILTHDFSWCVTSGLEGRVTGNIGKVIIGNNVFIGMDSIITKGTIIGDNVIIGAGSVVTKDCESNSVYAGVPAKKIMTIEEYYKKRIEAQEKEAIDIVNMYKERYNKEPSVDVLREYSFLFTNKTNANNIVIDEIIHDSGHYDICKKYLENNSSKFKDYEEFLKYCNKK